MTNRSYLQRLIARMGTPFGPPDAPAPPIYDPFAEVEALGEATVAPPSLAAQGVAVPPPQPILDFEHESERPPPVELGARVIHEFLAPPPVETIRPLDVPQQTADIPPEQPVPVFETQHEPPPAQPAQVSETQHEPPAQPAPGFMMEREPQGLIESVERETVRQVVYESIEPPEGGPPGIGRIAVASLQPMPGQETIERVMYELSGPPEIETSLTPLEPPVEPAAPPVTPIVEPHAPQITIGDIVVEIVARSDTPGRASSPPPRVARAAEAPAPRRAGVRSKRRYGLGQV
jgi:hypothetical protein